MRYAYAMQPNEPFHSSPQGNYDFILNHGQQPSKSILPGGGSMKQRIIVVAIGGGILLLIIIIVFALLLGGGGSSDQLESIAKTEAELIRISDIGTQKAKGPDARYLAMTTKLSLTSTQKGTLGVLGKKMSDKELATGRSSQTDATLNQAEQASRFDEVFTDVLKTALADYQKQLQQMYTSTDSNKVKQHLDKSFQQTTLLLGQQTATN